MAATQQALLMASDNAVTVPEACEADPYYSCGPENDPYWANVVLLLHMDGTDGSTTFVDSSPAARTIVAFSSAQVDTANKKFGTGSGYFPTGTNSYLTTGDGYDMPGDFTVEFWLRLDTVTRIGQILFALTSPSSSNHFYIVAQTNGTASSVGVAVGSASINDLTYDYVVNTWYHIAVVRSGSTVTLFKNGVERGTTTTTFSPLSTRVGQVGYEVGTGNSLYGYIDDLRITKGVARYTGNFNIPTAAFPDALETVWDPADPRTVLSLHADDVVVEDSSCYQPKTVTLSGTLGNIAEVTDAESKFGGKSFYIPNSGASTTAGIIVTDHMDLDFGTGDFTIEMWAYRTANTYYGTLFYGTYGGEFSLIVAPTTGLVVLNYRSSGGAQANIATGVVFPLTTWQHVVVQRRGTNFEFYLNGALGNTTAITGGASSTVNSAGDFYLGRTNASSALTWAGYIDEVRVTKGVARYSAAFDLATMPNCDSVVPGNIVAVPGTSPLTGMSVTVRQQTIGDQNGAVALSGVSATVNAGGLFSDSVTSSKTVALLGRSVTVSRGSITVPAYPNLSSSNRSYFIVTSPTVASLTVTFRPDGTWSAVDGEGATRFSGTWIDTAQTAYDIESISHLYRVLVVNIFVGYAPYYSYPTTPFTLSSDFVFVAQNLTYGTTVNFDFQITIAPTSANPRYGEAYYYGTHRFNTAIELAG